MLTSLDFLATDKMDIVFFGEINEDGENEVIGHLDNVSCRVQNHNGTAYSKDGKEVKLSLKVFIFESLESFPDDKISGQCTIGKVVYDIYCGSIYKNPDGTINHIVLELM